MTATRGFPIARCAGLFAGLLAFAFAMPSARATCGDYLHVAADKTTRKGVTPAAPLPCKCPQCSQGPCQPPAAPPVTDTTDGRDPALVSVLDTVPDDNRVRFATSASDRLPADDGPARIFHPPR